MEETMICPRCGNTEFEELFSGPDSYEDDVTWMSYICTQCRLYYSSWTDKWYVDCETWQDEEDAEEYLCE